jgi:tetratricopeptide (TPR) repeat protein
MDPSNPIVQLCVAGIAAEGEARPEDARALFEQAWAQSRSDYEACIAAHYVARHQPTPEQELEWNRIALERAGRADAASVQGWHASLYLNLAHSLEKLGRLTEACEHYLLADRALASLTDGPYAQLVRIGVTAGRRRTCRE